MRKKLEFQPGVFKGFISQSLEGGLEVLFNGNPLCPCLGMRNHSPKGFAWGYGGSGPAQLALAMLMACSNDKQLSLRHYQKFKWDVIANLPENSNWEMTTDDVLHWFHSKGVVFFQPEFIFLKSQYNSEK